MWPSLRIVALTTALFLGSCATSKVAQTACATSNTGAEADATFATLQRLQHDPKGHRVVVTSRAEDARGDIVKVVDVWPLSGPQEPAPSQKVRLVLRPCTFKLVKVERIAR